MKISSQQQLRKHGQPHFCYLCGGAILGIEQIDKDHCPPKGIFAAHDRVNFPIILPTHKSCNNNWNIADDLLGILTDALHSRQKSQDTEVASRLEAYEFSLNGKSVVAIRNIPLVPMANRIVRGMHALLYKSYLPLETSQSVHIPLPEASFSTGETIQPTDQAFVFSGEIHKALLTKTADQVCAYNGNFKYACVWDHLADGTPFCIYAFDIYVFHQLAPAVSNFPRCFVGMYIPSDVPQNASWASKIEFTTTRQVMLDPWQRT